MTPFFSIVIPIYKAETYLRQCVDSILTQSCGDFELILVEDGSPDSSGAICDEYAARDSRVLAVHQANAGPTPARRNGLGRARGQYVCFADADDWVVPQWLETLRDHIRGNGEPDMVLFDFFQVEGDEHLPPLAAPEGYYDKARLEREMYPRMLCDTSRQPFGSAQLVPGYLWSKAFRRELVADHFLADDRITVFEDVAMVYECLYHADSAYVTHQRLYAYRYLPQSNPRHYRPGYFREMTALADYLNARLTAADPVFAPQVNAFCVRRLINGIAGELAERGSVAAAAKNAAAVLDETGYARRLSPRGMPAAMGLFLQMVKLRLYRTATAFVKLRMGPDNV